MPTYSPVVGNNLSDVQAALSARDRLLAEQNIASQGNTVKFTQGMQQMAAQRAALQQQAMQQAQANQLAQQAQADTGYFNRGRLVNESDRIRADRMLAERAATDAATRFKQEDETRRYVADKTFGARSREPELIAEESQLADAANNFAAILNQKEELDAQLAQVGTAKQAAGKLAPFKTFAATSLALSPVAGVYDYFKNNDARKNAVFAQLPYQSPADPNVGLSANIANAETALAAKSGEIDRLIAPGLQMGLNQHVTKQNGRWVSTFKPSGGSYFVPRGTSTQTNAPAGFGGFSEGQIIYRQGVPYRVINGQPVPVQSAQ